MNSISVPIFLRQMPSSRLGKRSLGPERVVEIVMSDFLSELYPRFSRTAVVQSRPQSCLDDFTPQLLRRIEVAYRV
jgi:hypothetical protein